MVKAEFGYTGYFDRESCDLDEFKVLTSQSLTADAVPFAAAVEKNVPVYDMAALRPVLADAAERKKLMTEWAWVLEIGRAHV